MSSQTLIKEPESALREGIKIVGIGKKGSGSLPRLLIDGILEELKNPQIPAVIKGAFLGALIIKGPTSEEEKLGQVISKKGLYDLPALLKFVCPEAPSEIQSICLRLLQKEELDKKSALTLGRFLFSDLSGDGARGLCASILRVRYETADEYEGLLQSMQETIEAPFQNKIPAGNPIVQIAEPFDGVDHSYMITPLVADFIQKKGYRVVSLVGRNSGPKNVFNLLDVAQGIKGQLLQASKDLKDAPDYGWYLHQSDLSKAMDRWVDLRRLIVKRPFLATLERFINPFQADLLIASAFHAPYGEKMLITAERAGFKGIIIVRNGLEGTTAFPLIRKTKILCSSLNKKQEYIRHEIEFDAASLLSQPVTVEEKFDPPSLKINIKLIQTHKQSGKTDNPLFDNRIKVTCAGIRDAIQWIRQHWK